MNGILKLFSGEIKRLVTYKILPVSLATTFLWVILFYFLSKDDARWIAPLLIYVDITMMTILLIGASGHLEKQEGTIRSMMVMPVSVGQILAAKVAASIIMGLESAFAACAALFFIHGITLNYALIFLFVILITASHGAIGFFLTLYSKDFASMLGLMMAYIFPFSIPTILMSFGIIDVKYEWLLMLSPSHSGNNLISGVISGQYDTAKVVFACIYLFAITVLLFRLVVYPKFKSYGVRG